MTNEEMKAQIDSTAKAARHAGGKVEWWLSSGRENMFFEECDEFAVYPTRNDGKYVFRYSESDALKKEALEAAEKFNVEPEDYLLWVSQGW